MMSLDGFTIFQCRDLTLAKSSSLINKVVESPRLYSDTTRRQTFLPTYYVTEISQTMENSKTITYIAVYTNKIKFLVYKKHR